MSGMVLNETLIQRLEQQHPDGMTAQEVVSILVGAWMRFSEATFRKYVQTGLLPRSRRVRAFRRRGGSQGLYPVSVIRRVLEIKRLLADDFTMDEIRQKFLCATSEIDELEESLGRVFDRLEAAIDERERAGEKVAGFRKELSAARVEGDDFTAGLRKIEGRLEVRAQRHVGNIRVV